MNIGILGVGVIGRAITEAFCFENDLEHNIYLSPRSEKLSVELSNKYENVFRCCDNQEVLDKSEYVFIAVLPEKGLAILETLIFKKEHKVINLMSDKKLHEIRSVIGETSSLTHIVPLSFISKRSGPIAVYPSNKELESILKKLGNVIAVDSVEKIESIAAITALMAPYYTLLNNIAKWGSENNLSLSESKNYTTSFFEALSKHAGDNNLEILANEMTAGGLNEMAFNHIGEVNAYEPWTQVLEPIMMRLKKNDI